MILPYDILVLHPPINYQVLLSTIMNNKIGNNSNNILLTDFAKYSLYLSLTFRDIMNK